MHKHKRNPKSIQLSLSALQKDPCAKIATTSRRFCLLLPPKYSAEDSLLKPLFCPRRNRMQIWWFELWVGHHRQTGVELVLKMTSSSWKKNSSPLVCDETMTLQRSGLLLLSVCRYNHDTKASGNVDISIIFIQEDIPRERAKSSEWWSGLVLQLLQLGWWHKSSTGIYISWENGLRIRTSRRTHKLSGLAGWVYGSVFVQGNR